MPLDHASLAAGADILETSTFNSTRVAMADYRMEELVPELNREAARLARAVADRFEAAEPGRWRYVAGVLGPTNRTASISPDVNDPGARGVTFDALVGANREAAAALLDGGADLLMVETIFDTLNAKAALFAIEHGGPANQPVEVNAPGIRSCQFLGPDNQYSLDDLTVVWREGAQVVLTCTPTVVRGATGTCTAAATPGTATLEILGWSILPAETDTVLAREDGLESDSTWSGPMVASGEVRVRAMVNGTLDSASASLVVTARDWDAQPLKFVGEEFTPADLPPDLHELGSSEPSHRSPRHSFHQRAPPLLQPGRTAGSSTSPRFRLKAWPESRSIVY